MIRETKPPTFFASLLPLTAIAALATIAVSADASVSIALTIDDVAKASSFVARVVPIEQTSAWENGRIVTTTHARVERILAGSSSDGSADVRIQTLGGIVDGIGQRIEGEAAFTKGAPSIVFLAHGRGKGSETAFEVYGRAQGQLVIAHDPTNREIIRVRPLGALVARRHRIPLAKLSAGPTVAAFDGRDAAEVTQNVVQAWERTHAQ